jgi:predicted pyridoxine 5'-phosphate oxidase superfamily flavin-nucleotide-binding protein
MVKLNEEMKSVFSKVKIFPVATASKEGIPNVAPIAFVQLVSEDTLWIGDNYMVKSLANVRENPHLSIYVYDPDVKRCFQIKGKVEAKTSGPDFEKMKGIIKAKNEKYPAKTLLVVKITDVFECTPGATAGKKML